MGLAEQATILGSRLPFTMIVCQNVKAAVAYQNKAVEEAGMEKKQVTVSSLEVTNKTSGNCQLLGGDKQKTVSNSQLLGGDN